MGKGPISPKKMNNWSVSTQTDIQHHWSLGECKPVDFTPARYSTLHTHWDGHPQNDDTSVGKDTGKLGHLNIAGGVATSVALCKTVC